MLTLHFNSEAGIRAVPERMFTCAAVLSQMVFLIVSLFVLLNKVWMCSLNVTCRRMLQQRSGIDTRNMPFNINNFIMHLLNWLLNSLPSHQVCKKLHWLLYWFLIGDSKPRTHLLMDFFFFFALKLKFAWFYMSWKMSIFGQVYLCFMKLGAATFDFVTLQTRSENAGFI